VEDSPTGSPEESSNFDNFSYQTPSLRDHRLLNYRPSGVCVCMCERGREGGREGERERLQLPDAVAAGPPAAELPAGVCVCVRACVHVCVIERDRLSYRPGERERMREGARLALVNPNLSN
jgi:hypothetical protein